MERTTPAKSAHDYASLHEVTAPTLWQRAARYWEDQGVWTFGTQAALALTWPLWRQYFRAFPRTFAFASRRYPYLLHPHNLTWSNERAVEVPIVRDLVSRYEGRRVLEVGNVLAHYFPVRHDVVDKYERGPRVQNLDVLDFRSEQTYDLIVSISTLEHVGWDEQPRDPEKVIRAVRHLGDQLSPGGRMVATVPLGYNPHLDRLLAEDAVPFTGRRYLRRSGLTTWEEAAWDEVAGSPYGGTWPAARGLVIGEVQR